MADRYHVAVVGEGEKNLWDHFVESSPQGCLFCKSWWLDTVAPDSYEILGAYERGHLVGGLPLVRRDSGGKSSYGMPPLTQTLGVLLLNGAGRYREVLGRDKRITEALVEAVGSPDYFSQNFHANFTNWLPFMWAGYTQTTRYTYVLEDLTKPAEVWAALAKNIKSEVKKARKRGLQVLSDRGDPKMFWDVYLKTFERQGMNAPISFGFFEAFDRALAVRGRRRIFLVVDDDGAVHSGAYVVWDNRYAYYLMGAGDPALRSSGATSLGLWEAIIFSADVADSFDFEGSVIRRIETYFRAFGGRQRPYFQIRKVKTVRQRTKEMLRRIVSRLGGAAGAVVSRPIAAKREGGDEDPR